MGFLDPDGMDAFRRTEPSASLLGTQATGEFDVYRRTEPAVSLLLAGAGPAPAAAAPMAPPTIAGRGGA